MGPKMHVVGSVLEYIRVRRFVHDSCLQLAAPDPSSLGVLYRTCA